MKLVPIVVEVVNKGTHQGVTYCTINGALEKTIQMNAKFSKGNNPKC